MTFATKFETHFDDIHIPGSKDVLYKMSREYEVQFSLKTSFHLAAQFGMPSSTSLHLLQADIAIPTLEAHWIRNNLKTFHYFLSQRGRGCTEQVEMKQFYLSCRKHASADKSKNFLYFWRNSSVSMAAGDALQSWRQASQLCRSYGGHLPVFRSRDEMEELVSLVRFSANHPFTLLFIGLRLKKVQEVGQTKSVFNVQIWVQHFLVFCSSKFILLLEEANQSVFKRPRIHMSGHVPLVFHKLVSTNQLGLLHCGQYSASCTFRAHFSGAVVTLLATSHGAEPRTKLGKFPLNTRRQEVMANSIPFSLSWPCCILTLPML